jgi:hypothetical protein
MVMSWDQHIGQNHNIKIGNKCLKGWKSSKYLGTTLTNQNSIHEEIKSRQIKECLLSFSAESFVFQSLIQRYND